MDAWPGALEWSMSERRISADHKTQQIDHSTLEINHHRSVASRLVFPSKQQRFKPQCGRPYYKLINKIFERNLFILVAFKIYIDAK